jgi:uncharacterized protein (UPF0335 family)
MKDKRNTPEALETAQKCFLGFLKQYKKLVERNKRNLAEELINEEIKLVKENMIHDYDAEIFRRLLNLKCKLKQASREENVNKVKEEIDILATDLSISS